MSRKQGKDWELWERVKSTTVPLHSNRAVSDFKTAFEMGSSLPSPNTPKPKRIVRPYSPEPLIRVSLASSPPLLDDTTSRKIARGKLSIDGRVDLHGLTQAEAYSVLHRFVDAGFAAGKRTLLVITGKGSRGEGILRQAVPRWLSEPDFARKVIGFREAHITHGGSGALYIRLRNPQRVK